MNQQMAHDAHANISMGKTKDLMAQADQHRDLHHPSHSSEEDDQCKTILT